MPANPVDRLAKSFEAIFAGLETPSTCIEIMSEIENAHLAVELLNFLQLRINVKRITELVLSLQNSDGSFGSTRHSQTTSTYYGLGTLKILNYDVKALRDTLVWVKKCEVPTGGFVPSPELFSTYMEDTYYGVKALEVLEERPTYSEETLKFISEFQNPNGGFRRSIFLGISDFESTYQALSCIKTILSFLKR